MNEEGKRLSRFEVIVLGLLLLLALVLRLFHLDEQSLWWDEAQTWWFASHSITDLIAIVSQNDQHPPLYYLLMTAWLSIDTSEWWMRFFSVIFSVGAIPFVFSIGRMHSFSTAVIAAAVIACSPIQIQYAQEARMYAMMFFFASLTIWSVVRIIREERPTNVALVAYAVGAIGLLYSHNTGIFLFVTAFLVLLWNARYDKVRLRSTALLTGVAVLLWLPWIPSLIGQFQQTGKHFWIPPLQPGSVLHAIEQIVIPFHYQYGIGLRIAFVLVVVAIAVIGGRTLRNHKWLIVTMVAFIAIPFLSMTLISAWRPILLPKTILWIMIPLSILLGATLSSMKPRIVAVAAGVLIFLITASGGFYYFGSVKKEDWRSAAAAVYTLSQRNVFPLYTSPLSEIPLQYYWQRWGVEVQGLGIPAHLFDRGWEPLFVPEDEGNVRHFIAGKRELALVISHSWISDRTGRIPEIIEETHKRNREYLYHGIRIVHYRR